MMTSESITEVIARLRKVCAEATPGPWIAADEQFGEVDGPDYALPEIQWDSDEGPITIAQMRIGGVATEANQQFIAQARAVFPAALDCVEALAEVSTYLKSGMLCVDEPPAIRARIALAKFQKAAER